MFFNIYNFLLELFLKKKDENKIRIATYISRFLLLELYLKTLEKGEENISKIFTITKFFGKLNIYGVFYKEYGAWSVIVTYTSINKIIAKWAIHNDTTVKNLIYTDEFTYKFIKECMDEFDINGNNL